MFGDTARRSFIGPPPASSKPKVPLTHPQTSGIDYGSPSSFSRPNRVRRTDFVYRVVGYPAEVLEHPGIHQPSKGKSCPPSPDGVVFKGTNLVMGDGKPRLTLTFYLQWISRKLSRALRDSVAIQKVVYLSVAPRKGTLREDRNVVQKDCRVLVNAVLGVLRFFDSTEQGIKDAAQVAHRLVHIRWGDDYEWLAISDFHVQNAVGPMLRARQSVIALRDLIRNAGRQFDPQFLDIVKSLTDAYALTKRLYDAWHLEAEEPISCQLRRRAQERGDRAAWHMLQRRSAAFQQGAQRSAQVRDYLIKDLVWYLDSTRSQGPFPDRLVRPGTDVPRARRRRRSGISGDDYLDFYEELRPVLPHSSPVRPNYRLVPGRDPSPTTYPRGILRKPSPEGAFDAKTGSAASRPIRPWSSTRNRTPSVERYGRTG
ncbi:hypothetical protein JCM21900_006200 [Sporobolomyces salmonicolor]